MDIHKKMGGSDDLSLLHEISPAGSKLQTRPTRGTDDMPFGEDNCEENPLPDKENTPSSPLFASCKEKISNKTLTRKKRDDNSWIKEHPKEPQPSPPPISSLKGFTRKKREDGSWIRGGNTVREAKESQPSPPPAVVREQTEAEEAEESQSGYGSDVTRSIKTLKFREKLEFWKQKETRH